MRIQPLSYMTIFDEIMPNGSSHTIAVLIFDGVIPTDAAIPCDTFSRVRLANGECPYRVQVCSNQPSVDAGHFNIEASHSLRVLPLADTIIVPGITDISRPIPTAVKQALIRAANRGTRIASICTGAFVLADSGLLNDIRATTHWQASEELARRFPVVDVDPNALYIDNGQVLTSAGAMAGIDLCLYMIRKDYGADVASTIARLSVMPLERAGGQQQFIQRDLPTASNLQHLLEWIDANPAANLSIDKLAKKAALSSRTLHRRFVEQVGVTPAQWVIKSRIRYAQQLLEVTDQNVETVAATCGFGSSATFRDQFKRHVGTSPSVYRRFYVAEKR